MDNSHPPYRLLACDLDGTLMDDEITISPRVRQALAAAQARDVYVTLATGRGFRAALPFARQLNITVPIICYQGGVIKHPVSGELLYQVTMDRELILQAIELAHARDWHLVVYTQDTAYIQQFRHADGFYAAWLGSDIQRVDDLASMVRQDGANLAKFLIVADETTSDRIQAEMTARFGQHMNIVRSHSLFVEGNPLAANKGDGLRRLAAHLNVPQTQVMAIGDQGNDLAMLTWAGLGVAMGSGSAEAQAAADWIAPPLSADGAAVAIERFLLR
jgi:Cof subfamily protein (haloacid dehalogenase superfamily)